MYEAAKHKSFHCQKEALGRAVLPGPCTVVLAEGKVGTFLHLLPRLYELLRWLRYGLIELRMSSVKQEYSRVFFWKGPNWANPLVQEYRDLISSPTDILDRDFLC